MIEIGGLCDWLDTLSARQQYDGPTVAAKLRGFGVPDAMIPLSVEDGSWDPTGMSISGDLVRKLDAPYPGSFGGWGFQHSANVRALRELKEVRA